MSNPVAISIELPENCPKDIELMSIWANSTERYINEMSDREIRAAVTWFKSYIDSRLESI